MQVDPKDQMGRGLITRPPTSPKDTEGYSRPLAEPMIPRELSLRQQSEASVSDLWPWAQAFLPHLSCCCCFRRVRPWEGEAGRRNDWTPSCSLLLFLLGLQQPSLLWRTRGRLLQVNSDRPSEPSLGVRGAASVAWAHLTLTPISRNWWNGKTLWKVTFQPWLAVYQGQS